MSLLFVPMILPFLYIAPTAERGRGVFTDEDIAADTIIEIAPVIVMSKDDRKLIDQTVLINSFTTPLGNSSRNAVRSSAGSSFSSSAVFEGGSSWITFF